MGAVFSAMTKRATIAPTPDSELDIALPRTGLGGTDAAASSRVVQPGANGDQPGAPARAPIRTAVTATRAMAGALQSSR